MFRRLCGIPNDYIRSCTHPPAHRTRTCAEKYKIISIPWPRLPPRHNTRTCQSVPLAPVDLAHCASSWADHEPASRWGRTGLQSTPMIHSSTHRSTHPNAHDSWAQIDPSLRVYAHSKPAHRNPNHPTTRRPCCGKYNGLPGSQTHHAGLGLIARSSIAAHTVKQGTG